MLATHPYAARLLLREAMDWGPVIRGKLLDRILLVLEAGAMWIRAGQEQGAFVEGDPKQLVLSAIGLHFLPFALGQLVEKYTGDGAFDQAFVEARRGALGGSAQTCTGARGVHVQTLRTAPWRPAPRAKRSRPRRVSPEAMVSRPRANSWAIAASRGSVHCSRALRRSERRQRCGKAAIAAASASASARASPVRDDAVGEAPRRAPRGAPTARPVRIMSSARDAPTRRGRRTVPPSMSGTPQRRQKTPKIASSSATRRSHQSASSRPPGDGVAGDRRDAPAWTSAMRVGPIGPGPLGSTRFGRPSETATRSAPAQNVPPSPQSTATLAAASRVERLERGDERVGGVAGRRRCAARGARGRRW